MSTPGLHKNAFLYHLRIVGGAALITIVFSLVLFRKIFHDGSLNMLLLTFIQLEIFLYLGKRFFRNIKPEGSGFIRKTIVRLVLFYLTVLLIAFILFMSIYTFYFVKGGSSYSEFIPSLVQIELKTFLASTLVGFGLGALFFFYTQWTDVVKDMQKLREEKLIFQYETLKSQVNPHFLFNSLNTLSSLIHKDAEISDHFIQKLSAVYRYVLENQEKEMVPLEAELDFVRDFFELQQIRDEEKIELKIEINSNKKVRIMPVSLQMLVENALKHNLVSRKSPLVITIHFEGLDKVVVRNNLQERDQLSHKTGIGLKNLNERCKLILGRELEIQKLVDEFVVKVPVQLTGEQK